MENLGTWKNKGHEKWGIWKTGGGGGIPINLRCNARAHYGGVNNSMLVVSERLQHQGSLSHMLCHRRGHA